jgi:hypothetical protein
MLLGGETQGRMGLSMGQVKRRPVLAVSVITVGAFPTGEDIGVIFDLSRV